MRTKSQPYCRLTYFLSVAALTFVLGSAAYAANPVPTVTGPIHPQAVIPGRGDFILTVYGANFVSGAVVNWNRSPRSTTFVSARELQAKILAFDVAKPTAGYITVTNPAPGGGPSSPSFAIVEVHQPTKTIVPGPPHTYLLGDGPMLFLTPAPSQKAGTLDLLGGGGSGTVYLFTGKGDGTFTNTVVGHGYYNDYGNTHAVGDFNNDGKLDYIFPAGKFPNPASIEVRLGNGDGTFRTSWRVGKYNEGCLSFAVGDFNGDGNLDFAATVCTGSAVYIFLGNGDGTFRQGETYSGLPSVSTPLLADFSGDGKLDLVVESTVGISILLGNGDGTFQSPQTIFAKPEGCGFGVPLIVDDFNGDGKLDLAFCSRSARGQIGVLLGNGNGTFHKPVYYHAGTNYSTWAFTAGDFDSDGKTDFIVWYFTVPPYHPYFAILKGNGDGTFQHETTVKFPDTFEELGIVAGDFNSDGLLDFVMLPNGGGVRVYIQK